METRGLVTLVLTFHDGVFGIAVLLSAVLTLLLILFFYKKLAKERRFAVIFMTFLGSLTLLHYGFSHLLQLKAIDVEVIRLRQSADDGNLKPPS